MAVVDTELVLAGTIQRLSAAGAFRVEQLEQALIDRWEVAPVGWRAAFDALVDRNVVVVQDGDCSVSGDGRVELAGLTSRGFDTVLGLVRASDAYRQLNEQVSGFDLGQYSMVKAEQFDALVDALELGPGHRVLDLGCGVGRLAERVAERTGAHVTGLDFAPEAIAAAAARTRDRSDRQRFVVGDLNDLSLPAASYDAIISVDTLYFAFDLAATVRTLVRLLKPGGRLGILYTHAPRSPGDEWAPGPDQTPLAAVLADLGLAYVTVDYSAEEQQHWRRMRVGLRDLQPSFEAEGQSELHAMLSAEVESMVPLADRQNISRFLYLVRI
jgi:ubiquinone/menaquinone biosynthesis C-methylase UbiE